MASTNGSVLHAALVLSKYKPPAGLSIPADATCRQVLQCALWTGSSVSSTSEDADVALTYASWAMTTDMTVILPEELGSTSMLIDNEGNQAAGASTRLSLHVTATPGVPTERLDEVAQSLQATYPHLQIVASTNPPKKAPNVDTQLQTMVANAQVKWHITASADLRNNAVLAAALSFFWQTANLSWRVTGIRKGQLPDSFSLDPTASETIHQWPEPTSGEVSTTPSSSSLFGSVANLVKTTPGKRCWSVWLQQPLTHLPALQQRQDAVSYFVDHGLGRDAIREGLSIGDWTALAATLDHYRADANEAAATGSTRRALQALYQLYLLGHQELPRIVESLQNQLQSDASQQQGRPPEVLIACYVGLAAGLKGLSKSVGLVTAVLDMNQAPREFVIQSSYKSELGEIQEELGQLQEELQACHDEMNQQWAEATGTSATNLVRLEEQQTTDRGGTTSSWQFRLANTNDSKALESQFGSYVTIHRILKNGVYFSTKQLRQLSSKNADLMAEYERHQKQVVVECMQVAATYAPVIDKCVGAVAQLDVILALAHLAAYNNYCRPQLTDSDDAGEIVLKQARHPCVELQDLDFIPNDISLRSGQSSFLLVTGPNMGGKSTYIRSLGAIVTLAQVGSFVPCASATINLCHSILARVGAGDLQDRGISTFMAEMLESSSILKRATRRSLIIIDELGRGTNTFDGYGLARAISEYIVQTIGCMTVFTTHFHELTALEQQEATVQNCHVTAQKGTHGLTFLYEVRPGPCLESFGIQVAEMANVPAVVVEDAKRKAKELENFEYRKQVSADDAMEVDATSNNPVTDHASSEEASEALAFVHRFRRVPIDGILNNNTMGDEEKKAALRQALELC